MYGLGTGQKSEATGSGIVVLVVWQSTIEILKKNHAKAVERRDLQEHRSTLYAVLLGRQRKETYVVQSRSFEETTTDIAGQCLEVLGKDKA